MNLNITKYNNFLFDFDGVITDSVDIKTQAFGALFAGYGDAVRKKVVDYHLANGGVSRYEKFKYYYKNILNKEINEEVMDMLDRQFSELVRKKVIETDFIKGVMSFIKTVKNSGKKCFVISATPEKEIKTIVKLRSIEGFFEDIVGSPNTKEENLDRLFKEYGIESRESVYFGDALSDYKAACSKGIDFIGIVNKKNRELKALEDVQKIEDFSDIETEIQHKRSLK